MPAFNVASPIVFCLTENPEIVISSTISPFEFLNITLPANNYFQYSNQTILLSTLGLVAGNFYQFELSRRVAGVSGGTNLPSNWLLCEMTIEFN